MKVENVGTPGPPWVEHPDAPGSRRAGAIHRLVQYPVFSRESVHLEDDDRMVLSKRSHVFAHGPDTQAGSHSNVTHARVDQKYPFPAKATMSTGHIDLHPQIAEPAAVPGVLRVLKRVTNGLLVRRHHRG